MIDALLSLPPSSSDSLVAIRVRPSSGKYHDVVGVGSDGAEYGLDCMGWEELVDLPVEYREPLTAEEALASLLWEVTWYGFSPEEVRTAREALMREVSEEQASVPLQEEGVEGMAADLYIHIFQDITEEDLRIFFSSTLGSKYYDETLQVGSQEWDEAYDKVAGTPRVWIGEVSWLKASLLGDAERYIPDAVQRVTDIIGEDLPVIDDHLIAQIEQAITLPNHTAYRVVSDPKEVVEFLRRYKGKRCFTVSW